jgi:hypothetical protein
VSHVFWSDFGSKFGSCLTNFEVYKSILILFLLLLLHNRANAQTAYGVSAGVSFNFGTHVNRIGISANYFYVYNFVQINSGLKVYYNFQSLGIRKKTPEVQLGGGINFGFGQRDSIPNRFIGLSENNTGYHFAAGYSYLRYWDKNQTTQSTAIFNFQLKDLRVLTENDLFASGKGWRDRFRTGAFMIDYSWNDLRFGVNATFWTGDYVGCEIVKDSIYPNARFGYRKAEGSKYGNFSLGLLSAQVSWLIPQIPVQQIARLNIGIDSEKVRNTIQNKFIHNQRFVPSKWVNYETPHIPMLTADGTQFLYQKSGVVKPLAFYFNMSLNDQIFY